jgi:hypothetical protein
MARWWKRMSRTDAQQPTKGRLVPYLRLTEGEGDSTDPGDHLFQDAVWGPGHHGEHAVDESHVDFEVIDDDKALGNYDLRLTYDPTRPKNHAHPALWIHWGDLSDYLQKNDREGWYVVVERNDDAVVPLSLTFQRAAPA